MSLHEDQSQENHSQEWPQTSPENPTTDKKESVPGDKDGQVSPILTSKNESPVPISNLTEEESPGQSSLKMKPVTQDSAGSSDNIFQPVRRGQAGSTGIDVKDENEFLKGQLADMHSRLEQYQDEGAELIEFNKELQWTLMMMKKESDTYKENIEFLNKGGQQKDWDEM